MREQNLKIKPTILKLGGSVITEKNKVFTPNKKAINRLAKEISEANVSRLILVHGGGSFGHPLAKQYRIKEGFTGSSSQIFGFSKTHEAMVSLNKLIVDALINHNISAVSLAPSSFVFTKSGRILHFEDKPLTKFLEMGFVPVLYGDAVLDLEIGFTILSGDQLTAFLASKFDAQKILIGIDVDGLFTNDPKTYPSAQLIPKITLQELKNMQHKMEEPKVTDVTGGMLGKILELTPVVEGGIPVIIVNAAKPKNVYKALKGEKVLGTLIEKG
jgi:isopentenyl phosphate kinase